MYEIKITDKDSRIEGYVDKSCVISVYYDLPMGVRVGSWTAGLSDLTKAAAIIECQSMVIKMALLKRDNPLHISYDII